MASAVTMFCLVLACLFVWSGVGKLRASRDRSAATLEALRLRVSRPDEVVRGVALVEVALGIALVITSGRWLVAVAVVATLVLTSFLLVVVRAHNLGSVGECGCFGAASGATIGPRLIVRNALLVAIALALALLTGAGAAGGVPAFLLAVAGGDTGLLVTVVAALLGVAAALATAPGSATAAGSTRAGTAAGREVDAEADPSRAASAGALLLVDTREGRVVDARRQAATRAQLLVFVSAACHACDATVAELARRSASLRLVADLHLVIGAGADDALAAISARWPGGAASVSADLGGAVASSLGLDVGRPQAVLLAVGGAPLAPAVGSAEIGRLMDLLERAAADRADGPQATTEV